jgi:hypothetical protein
MVQFVWLGAVVWSRVVRDGVVLIAIVMVVLMM